MRCKIILIHTILVFAYFLGLAQTASPYQLRPAKEGVLAGGGIMLMGGSYLLQKKVPSLTPAQIQQLNSNAIPRFDRFTIRQFDGKARKASDVFLMSAPALPFLLFADPAIRKDWKTVGLMGVETFVLNVAITNLTKSTVLRTRPYAYNPNVPMTLKEERDTRFSFVSGHTSTVACMSFYTAKVYTDYHPGAKENPWIWAAAATLPAVTGFLRVKGGKHFPTDVIGGYLLGTAIGIAVPYLHQKR